MQHTNFRADEAIWSHDYRMPSNMEADYKFAEKVHDERSVLIPATIDHCTWLGGNIWYYTDGNRWWIAVWLFEALAVLGIGIMIVQEIYSGCPIVLGLDPYCRRCGSLRLLSWLSVAAVGWAANLFVYTLLVSRGFRWSIMKAHKAVQENRPKGIPGIAVMFFFAVSIGLFVWLVVGLVVLISTNRCLYGGKLAPKGERSFGLFLTVVLTLIFFPILFLFGRVVNCDGRRKPPPQRRLLPTAAQAGAHLWARAQPYLHGRAARPQAAPAAGGEVAGPP